MNFQNQQNQNTALLAAARLGHADIVKILLSAGADVNIYNNQNYSALMLATQFDNKELVKMVIDAGAEVEVPVEQKSPINLASRLGRVENLKELLAAHGNNQECQTAQGNATRVSDTTSVKDLIGTGSYATNKTLNEPLISAVKNGHAEMVEELLKYGADVNATDEDGDTALMTAIKLSIQPIFQLLVDWGAEVNAENNEGQTALYLAVTQSHTEYDRMQKQDQNKELVLEGSSLIVYTLLRKGTHLYETRSRLNPCTVHLTSAEFKNPKPYNIKAVWMLSGFKEKENIKELSSVDHFQACAKDCIREHLEHVHPKRSLYFTVPQLGIPKRLQSSLLLNAVKHSDVIPNNQETKNSCRKSKKVTLKMFNI